MTLIQITRTATRVATFPIAAASFATGLVKGSVKRLAGAVAGGDAAAPEPVGATARDAGPRDAGPQVVPLERFPAAAPQRAPEPPAEGFAHEPHPASAQPGSSRRPEAAVDDWDGDAELALHPDEEPAADSVVEALARNDRPGEDQVDHEAISATLREAERLRGVPEG